MKCCSAVWIRKRKAMKAAVDMRTVQAIPWAAYLKLWRTDCRRVWVRMLPGIRGWTGGLAQAIVSIQAVKGWRSARRKKARGPMARAVQDTIHYDKTSAHVSRGIESRRRP